ncbi:MAG: hypothetical protein ACXADY_15105 [Candidatus Hodarchaeales archaeon]|jgi:RecB family endonuclease NucS
MYDRTLFKNLKEEDLQRIYYTHPYLLDKDYLNCGVEQFYQLSSGIADLVIFNDEFIDVIELKKVKLTKSHILQATEYVKDIMEIFPGKRIGAIIVGRKTPEDFTRLLRTYDYTIKIKFLNEDVPVRIKICSKCRLANSIIKKVCWNCKNLKWI